MKANSNQAVIATLARLGAGADVVSEGELSARAPPASQPDKIMFSGVGKTRGRNGLRARRRHPVLQRRIRAGARALSDVASARGPTAPHRHPRQSGRRRTAPTPRSRPASRRTSSAFRSRRAREVYAHAARCPASASPGVDMHIGSQITDLQPFDDAFALVADFVRALRGDGHAIDHVDLGGGLGIPYRDDNDPPPLPTLCRDCRARAPARSAAS